MLMNAPPAIMSVTQMQTAPILLADITALVRKDLLEMGALVQVNGRVKHRVKHKTSVITVTRVLLLF